VKHINGLEQQLKKITAEEEAMAGSAMGPLYDISTVPILLSEFFFLAIFCGNFLRNKIGCRLKQCRQSCALPRRCRIWTNFMCALAATAQVEVQKLLAALPTCGAFLYFPRMARELGEKLGKWNRERAAIGKPLATQDLKNLSMKPVCD